MAELDGKDLRDEVAAAQARKKAAAATLDRLLAGSRRQEIAEARAAVLQAQADLDNKKLDYDRMEGLLERRAVPVSRRDNARAAYLMAQEARRRAQESYSLVKEGPRKEDIAQARAELKQMQANLELAQTRLGYTDHNGAGEWRRPDPAGGTGRGGRDRRHGFDHARIWITFMWRPIFRKMIWPKCDWAKKPWSPPTPIRTKGMPVGSPLSIPRPSSPRRRWKRIKSGWLWSIAPKFGWKILIMNLNRVCRPKP